MEWYVVGALVTVVVVLAVGLWQALDRIGFLEDRVRSLDEEQQRHCWMLTAHQQDGPRLGVLEAQLLRIQEEQARSLKWQGEHSVPAIGRPA